MDDCVFCKIIAGQLPAAVVYRDETVMAFMSLQQLNEGHTLVIPIQHFKNIYELPQDLAGPLLNTAARIARAVKREFEADGVWVSQFNEPAAGQSVRQKISLQQGIPSERAKEIVKLIKDSKKKAQASIQGDTVRVSSKDRDELQAIIALLRGKDLGVELQFTNYRTN